MIKEVHTTFSFINYTREIFSISREKHVDVGIAYSMLKADILSGKRSNTGDVSLPGFDYEAAVAGFESLSDVQREDAYGEWHDFMRRCYEAVCRVWEDADKLNEVIAAYLAEVQA